MHAALGDGLVEAAEGAGQQCSGFDLVANGHSRSESFDLCTKGSDDQPIAVASLDFLSNALLRAGMMGHVLSLLELE